MSNIGSSFHLGDTRDERLKAVLHVLADVSRQSTLKANEKETPSDIEAAYQVVRGYDAVMYGAEGDRHSTASDVDDQVAATIRLIQAEIDAAYLAGTRERLTA